MAVMLWWAAITVLLIWGQTLLPGVCLFSSAFIVSLQNEPRQRSLWLAGVWILIMEGCGAMAFGYGILWFTALYISFFVGQYLFDARSHLFMGLLGAASGAFHFFFILLLTILESAHFPVERMLWESVLQMASFPLLWFMMDNFFPERLKNDERHL